VLLREKVRAVRIVRETDGIVREAQEALEQSIVKSISTTTQSRGYLCDRNQGLKGEADREPSVSSNMLRLLGC
jgi:hypothetical protein